jgi:diacylglycerol kinase
LGISRHKHHPCNKRRLRFASSLLDEAFKYERDFRQIFLLLLLAFRNLFHHNREAGEVTFQPVNPLLTLPCVFSLISVLLN